MVSTAIGVEGLPVTPGVNVIIADDPESFALSVIRVLQDSELRTRIERRAREFVEKDVSWDKAADIFRDICCRVVDNQKHLSKSIPHAVPEASMGVDAA